MNDMQKGHTDLAKSEDKMLSILNALPLGIHMYRLEPNGRLVFIGANPAADRILGVDNSIFIGKTIEEAFPPLKATEVPQRYREAAASGKEWTTELIEYNDAGIKGAFEVHAFQTASNAMVAAFSDITARKRVEEALQKSEERFRDLAESLPLTVFEMDLQGRFTYVNRAALENFGYSQQDLNADLTMIQIIAPEDRDRAQKAMIRRIAGITRGHSEYQGLRKDGTSFPITVASSPILRDGQPVGLRGIVTDLTERKQLDDERLKFQKLESIGTLAGGIAHDFNNLLQGIFGYISLAKMTIEQKDKALAMLDQAEKALHQSVNLSTQLLTFSKGGKPLKKVFNLRPVIENAIRFSLSGSRVDHSLVVDENIRSVDADEGQIAQVIQNIIINAEQSMPLGGKIEITARNTAAANLTGLPHDLQGDLVEITVRDQGIGIPPDHVSRIFDPYFTTKERGSGLGLATSYSIIRNHGGVIHVSSELGKGSTFTIYLPATSASLDQTLTSQKLTAGRKGRILVMDDEKMVREVAGELISSLGHKVAFAEHGESAISQYNAAMDAGKSFDIVVLDLTIKGGMGGLETLQKLLEIDPEVKAVVSSGYSDDSSMSDYLSRGFKACLKKPYNIENLHRTLNDILEQGSIDRGHGGRVNGRE